MSTEFWLGTLLSIPVGIGTGLVIPQVQRRLDALSKRRALSAKNRTRQKYGEALSFRLQPEVFTHFLIYDTVRVIASAVVVILASIPIVLTSTAGGRFAVFLLEISICLLIISMVSFALRYARFRETFWRVHAFNEYAEKVPIEVRRKVDAEFKELEPDSSERT